MRSKNFLWAILLLVMVNFIVLGGAWQNRSNDTDAAVILTEREIRPHRNYGYNRNRENSGLSLQLRTNEFVVADWFDQAKLEELGFDFDRKFDDKNASRYYRNRESRKAFVVLEYEGDAWRKFKEGLKKELAELGKEVVEGRSDLLDIKKKQEGIERKLNNASRLFAIDVGKNPKLLRKRYDEQNRYVITAVEVGLRSRYYGGSKDKKNQPTGRIKKILTRTIHVPLEKRAVLDFLESKAGRDKYKYGSGYGDYAPPRYKVLVQYGSRYEPWIGRIELLEAELPGSEG